MKNRIYLIGCLSLIYVCQACGQSYGTSLGVRLGNDRIKRTVGLSLKQRIMKRVTLEGIMQTDFRRNSTFHALIEHHRGVLTKRFNFYMGGGLSFGSEESVRNNRDAREIITTYGNATVGVDLIFGLEFTLLKHSFSVDYKPNFNLAGREPLYRGQVGFSARGVLVKGSTQNKRQRQRTRERKKKLKEKERNKKRGTVPSGNFLYKVFKKQPSTTPSN